MAQKRTSALNATGYIRIRGARTHNLRDLDVDLPRDRLVVVTGVSGSGKSSLAFDTLYAEGQRRFLDSLSAHTRQLLQTLEPPDVDEIEGLPPALAVEQHIGRISVRSTLATLTEIHDHLRVLFARLGVPHCPQCGREITTQPAEAIVDRILSLEAGRKVMLLAPLVRSRKGAHRDVFERIVRDGFVRSRVDGTIVDAADPPALKKSQAHTIEAVIDRIVVKDGLRPRLLESVNLALKQGDGACIVCEQEGAGWRDSLYSSRFACPDCEQSFPPIETRSFSFNSPVGACPECQGLGERDGTTCIACEGTRLGPVPRAVTWQRLRIHELCRLTVMDALAAIRSVGLDSIPASELPVVQRVLPEVVSRLQFLNRLGLGYLALDRSATSLSGGELQRARLGRCLGTGLTGVCYVLDEPTQGLHPRDTARLLETLSELRDQGNTVVVVEHDPEVMQSADWLIDIGPGPGAEGGRLVAAGAPADVARHSASATAKFLDRGCGLAARLDAKHTTGKKAPSMRIDHATARNLKEISVQIPLQAMTCVTGVSGSGKTSLVHETLVPLVKQVVSRASVKDREEQTTASLAGAESLARLVEVDQSPLGRTGRSNPATASGVWDHIRRLFARTKEARLRGYTSRRFSFNHPGGRCDLCRGTGSRRLTATSLIGLETPCPECRGLRFNRQTLRIRFNGHSVADVLALRIDSAREFFANIEPIRRTLDVFVEVGLGYLPLGQPAPTLSGGEAQRIKLAAELGRVDPLLGGATLFVLDEPTTGLHPADVERLILLLERLTGQGHTVVVVEHHLAVIAAADWVIDLGPEGGEAGGYTVAQGSPAEIAKNDESHTGQALKRLRLLNQSDRMQNNREASFIL